MPDPGTVCEVESRIFSETESKYDGETWFNELPQEERIDMEALSKTVELRKHGPCIM